MGFAKHALVRRLSTFVLIVCSSNCVHLYGHSPSVVADPIQETADETLATITSIDGLGEIGEVRKVATGFQFTEGPAYHAPSRSLYFTDVAGNTIYRLNEDLSVEPFLTPSGHCNGLMFDGAGQLLACQMDKQLQVIDLDTKAIRVLADRFNGTRFNAPNDLVIDALGGVYFTDPRYRAPEPWPQGKEAFYYRAAGGEVTRLGDDLDAPNGIILSPDEKTLYVIPSVQKQMFAYEILEPGKLGPKRVLCELVQPRDEENTGGDGLAIDEKGNLYITAHLGVQVVSPEGKILGVIEFPEQPANCAFGGIDRQTLYATCRTSVYSVKLPVRGHVFPGKVDE